MSAINENVKQESALREAKKPFHLPSLKRLSDFSRKRKVQTFWHPSYFRMTRVHDSVRHSPDSHSESGSSVPNLWHDDGENDSASPQRQDRDGFNQSAGS